MSNRTKIKKRAVKPTEFKTDKAGSTLKPQKQSWQPSQTLLASVIFLSLGIAIFGKSLYLVIPAGVAILALLLWVGLKSYQDGRGYKSFKLVLMPSVLIIILLVIRVITILEK